jgi:hypothetical protein
LLIAGTLQFILGQAIILLGRRQATHQEQPSRRIASFWSLRLEQQSVINFRRQDAIKQLRRSAEKVLS